MARKIPPGPLAGKQPDGEQVLATIKKSEREEIVVKTSIYHGYFTVHLRLRFQDKEGEWHFTREGVTLKPGEETDKAFRALAEARDIWHTLNGATPVTNPAVTSGTTSPSPPPVTPASSNGHAEPQSETAKLILKNNPRLTLAEINADRVARGLAPLT